MTWVVGQRVRNRPECAHVYEGTPWHGKMSQPREGTIVELPYAISNSPEHKGTMLVHWDSLVGDNGDLRLWQRWMHSDFVAPITETTSYAGGSGMTDHPKESALKFLADEGQKCDAIISADLKRSALVAQFAKRAGQAAKEAME